MKSIREDLKEFFPAIDMLIREKEEGKTNDHLYDFCLENLEDAIENNKLTYCILNQILHLFNEAGLSKGFFKYYFIYDKQVMHLYEKKEVEGFSDEFTGDTLSHSQLIWGLRCFFIDALLIFGNIRSAYRELRGMDYDKLKTYFKNECCDTENMINRSESLKMKNIEKNDRYYLSEIITNYLDSESYLNSIDILFKQGNKGDSIETKFNILEKSDKSKGASTKNEKDMEKLKDILFPTFQHKKIESLDLFNKNIKKLHSKTQEAGAINNNLYLSQANEIDIYVATSMRNRADFDYAYECVKTIKEHNELMGYKLRIFDPTNCVAKNPYDKGLTECLMVKCSKVLIYLAGEKDSFGKDAEAAIALSLGKPVIIVCNSKEKANIFRNIHPLTRLIKIDNGVACGAIITENIRELPALLKNIFSNKLKYSLEKKMREYEMLHLKESITASCVRLETSDKFLSEAFWNNYNNVV